MDEKRTKFGIGLEMALREALAWKRGEIELEVRDYDPMPPKRIKSIRKTVAKTTEQFQAKFGIPASTMNNWEQGRRKPDPAARLLLLVIEQSPDVVERAAHPTR